MMERLEVICTWVCVGSVVIVGAIGVFGAFATVFEILK